MWFKSAVVYRIEADDALRSIFANPERLESAVGALRFKSTGAAEMSSVGFVPVLGRKTEAFTFTAGDCCFFKIREENKLLPSSVIKAALEEETENRENELGRPLSKGEKQTLKAALIAQMTARAFSTSKEMSAAVNLKQGIVLVAAGSAKRAENVIALIRKAIGSFPAVPLRPRCVVEDRLTSFVTDAEALPAEFKLGTDAVLKSADDEGGTVRISKDDLTAEEVLNHIKAGKLITDLQLSFEDSLSFVLSSTLSFKRISIEDQYMEKNLPEQTGDEAADIQGFLIVQADLLTRLTAKITKIFDCSTEG